MELFGFTVTRRQLALASAVVTAAVIGATLLAVTLFSSDDEPTSADTPGTPAASETSGSRSVTAVSEVAPTATPALSTAPTDAGPTLDDPTETFATMTPVDPVSTPVMPTDTTPPLITGPNFTGAATLATEFGPPCGPDVPRTKIISAQITDQSGVRDAFVHFEAPGGVAGVVRMDVGAVFAAVIGPFSAPGGTLSIWIQARDNAGNVAISLVRELTLVPCGS